MAVVNPNAVMQAIKGLYNPMPVVLDPFKTVGYKKPAILELGDNVTYASLEIITNLPVERISRISLEKGGREFSGWPAELFHVRDRYLKQTVDNKKTRIYLDFADETLRTTTGIRRGELAIGNGERFTLKLQIDAKESGDPEHIELECHARELPMQSGRFFLPRFTELTIDHTVAGEQKHTFPLMGMNNRIRRMWLKCGNSDISDIEIKRDRRVEMESSCVDYNFNLERYYKKMPQDDWQVIDFIPHGWAAESAFIPVANESLQLVLTKATPEPVSVFFEYLEQEQEVPTA